MFRSIRDILLRLSARFLKFALPFVIRLLLIRAPNWRLPPGPVGNWLPTVGSLPLFSIGPSHLMLTKVANKFGKIYRLKLGPKDFIVISDPTLLREAFSTDAIIGRSGPYLNEDNDHCGIIRAEGDLLESQRAFIDRLMPNLTLSGHHMHNIFVERASVTTKELLKDLENLGGRPLAFELALGFCANNILFSTLVGTVFVRNDLDLICLITSTQIAFKMSEVISLANFLPHLAKQPVNLDTLLQGWPRKAAFLHYMERIVDTHREELDPDNPKDLIDAFLVEMDRPDSPEIQHFNESQLYEVLLDIFSMGLVTISTTLRWLLLAIIKYPYIQEKIQEETDRFFGFWEFPTLGRRAEMPYLQATILEGLRFSTIFPIGIPHNTVKDTTIGGYKIPKNAMVVGLYWKIHRDPNLWKNDPDTFNPYNHLDDNGAIQKSPNLMPFSTGQRSCLGEEVTLNVIFIIFANLLHRFKITSTDDTRLPSLDDSMDGLIREPLRFHTRFIRRGIEDNSASNRRLS